MPLELKRGEQTAMDYNNAQFSIEQRRARQKRFFEPPEKGEGSYLAVTSPINDSGILPVQVPPPKDLDEQWLSADYAVKCTEAAHQNTYWGLDALHTVFVNFGPGVLAALVGAPYKLMPGTIWFDLEPPIKDWNTPHDFKVDPGLDIYKAIETKTRALCDASDGRFTISVTDIGGQMDVLFSLRGEDILTDMMEYPDEVKKTEKQLNDEWIKYFNTITKIIEPAGCGYGSWGPVVNDKPWYPIQCDMSVMISPKMFEEFVLPELDRVSATIGQTIYHLDGPEEIRHLDMLLTMKHNTCIQWTPLPHTITGVKGTGQDFADKMSIDIYKRSLAAGKKVALFYPPANQIEKIFNEVGPDGFYIITNVNTRKEADEFIEHAMKQKWVKI